MRALVTVAGHDLPDPSEFSATTSTIVDSARNTQGVMIGAVIRESVVKAELNWKYLTAEQWADILKLFNKDYGGSFINKCQIYLQELNDWVTVDCYCSDRTAKIWLRNEDGGIRGYTGCRIALIQV